MSGELRVVVVGVGSMGANHVRVVAQHPLTELVGVVDQEVARAEAMASSVGVPHAPRLEDLGPYDAVVVAVPTEHHLEVALALIEAGTPVLVEKPLAAGLAEAESLVTAAGSRGGVLMCGFVERFNPAVSTAVGLLVEPPIHVMTIRHSPPATRIRTSVVHDLLIHDIDLALRLVPSADGTEPVASTSWASPAGVVELADCSIPLGGSAVATLSASRVSQRKVRSMTVSTANTLIEVDLLRHDVTVYRHRFQEQIDQGGPTYRAETVVDIPFVRHRGEPLAMQLEHFVGLVRGELDPAAEISTLMAPHRVAAQVAEGPCLSGVPSNPEPGSLRQ
jgi:predicted dehydrogenase